MHNRAHNRTYHKMSPKHLQRFIVEFVGMHNQRPLETISQMNQAVDGMGNFTCLAILEELEIIGYSRNIPLSFKGDRKWQMKTMNENQGWVSQIPMNRRFYCLFQYCNKSLTSEKHD